MFIDFLATVLSMPWLPILVIGFAIIFYVIQMVCNYYAQDEGLLEMRKTVAAWENRTDSHV